MYVSVYLYMYMYIYMCVCVYTHIYINPPGKGRRALLSLCLPACQDTARFSPHLGIHRCGYKA